MCFFFLTLIYVEIPRRVTETDCDDSSFNYIVELKGFNKICFGAGTFRDTGCIGKGLSPQQKKITPELNMKTAPGCYNIENITSSMYKTLNKVRSILGVPPLASRVKRFKTGKASKFAPDAGKYSPNILWPVPEKHAKPFGVGSKVRVFKTPNTPSPADYNLQNVRLCRQQNFQYNFGRPKRVPCVETVCIEDPSDYCHLCGKQCKGEYWHKNYDKFMCQVCAGIENATGEFYNRNQLKQFKKIRNCSFMHEHNKTTAAVRILSPEKIKKKLDIENYLNLYIRCF
ncbi:uncharacterized protein LOC130898306 [Diorhabda carinulata]|uniref:uncharacterized protein LOC130898306 n=1 Tax=Diorhabda carinulata TaxID=1163345 RepID=UPI0025A0A284|nr:uncharacterized protein LOC130898306 [Diorhabda carinulata]